MCPYIEKAETHIDFEAPQDVGFVEYLQEIKISSPISVFLQKPRYHSEI
jgi:hypothetical protein